MRVGERLRMRAGREQVGALISDPRRWPEFMDGLVVSDVLGDEVTACGARWSVRLQVGAAALGGTVEVVEFQPPGDLAWTGVTGVGQRGRWRLRERVPGRTEVELRLAYQAPGGLVGVVADHVAAPAVRGRLRRSLYGLRELVEDEQLSRG